jgi:ElaB/YqjD/DUF883 family membrane-anchored ribosome-binding protein
MGVLAGLGSLVKPIGQIVDSLHTSEEERQKAKYQIEALLQQRDAQIEETFRREIDASKDVILAEMHQGDTYTRRARPTVVYVGLGLFIINYGLLPIAARFHGNDYTPIAFPAEFWWAWSTVVSVWFVGRTMERRGLKTPLLEKVTG